jgi:ATP-dependent helicase/DNAse subunit B
VPLTLITGPANAAKAGALLDAYREVIDRAPILVVPTFGDVDFYQRDLAARGDVFGTDVKTFRDLTNEIGKRTGARSRPVGRQARERIAARAVSRAKLETLAPAAASPGFPAHFVRLAEELGQSRIEPARFTAALRDWGEGGQYATEVARLFSAYREELERLNRPDAEMARTRSLDALRDNPEKWGGTPVFFYGFDELDPLQFDAIETLARHVDVWFSLTYEAGRAALAARARTHQDLIAIGAAEKPLPAIDDYYESPALHGIERGLMEPPATTVKPAGAVLLLEGGGERAEAEIVAAKVAGLIADGIAPEEIAVVHRGLRKAAPLLESVFTSYGIPVALPRTIKGGHTALGRGIVAAIKCALGRGDAEDLVDYLRTPGLIRQQRKVDDLEARIRIDGVRDAGGARALWEADGDKLDAIDWLARDARRGNEELCDQVESQITFLLAQPHYRQAAVLDGDEMVDARAAAAISGALREFKRLPPQLAPKAAELPDVLAELEVFVGGRSGQGLVTLSEPQAVRARRVQALFCMGMVQGTFPKPSSPAPFFDDSERRAINAATGLRLRLRDDPLQTERFFFYMACSRPQRLLALSWPSADDDGKPLVRSLFVDDLLEQLSPQPELERRDLGAVGWARDAPTPREAQRAELAAAKGHQEPGIAHLNGSVLGSVRETEAWSATALETWIGCPVRWLAERRLKLKRMEPDGEALVRGQLTHDVLEDVFNKLDGPLRPADLPKARELLDNALDEGKRKVKLSVSPERLAAEAHRVEADLIAYLEHAAGDGSSFTPEYLEKGFGGDEDELDAMVLGDGPNKLRGRIDRIDVGPGGKEAIVWDYKGRGGGPEQAKWGAVRPGAKYAGKIQLALYMLAAERLLGYDVVGGLYQPMNARKLVARGAVLDTAETGLKLVKNDLVDEEALRELLTRCEADALKAIAELHEGLLEGRARTCGWKGGCDHPSICRSEAAEL